MDDGEELQITDVSGWAWLVNHRESQDRNFGALHALPLELEWGSPPKLSGKSPDSSLRFLGLQLAFLPSLSYQVDFVFAELRDSKGT